MSLQGLRHIRIYATAVLALLVIAICVRSTYSQNTFPTPSGSVGIGTTSPTRQLTVSGANQADLALVSADQGALVTDGFNLQQNGVNTYLINREAGNMSFWTNAIQQMTILSSGNVGIGITPANRFHIKLGSTYDALTIEESEHGRQFRIVAPNATTGATLFRNTFTGADFVWERNPAGDGATFVEDMRLSGGNLGIGTYAPLAKLQSQMTSAAAGVTGAAFAVGTATLPYALTAGHYDGNYAWIQSWTYPLQINSLGNNTILNSGGGYVGIGTSSAPTERLEVNGNIKLSGTINAKYQDVAEWVPSSERLAAGTVVVLDSTKSNQVVASTQSYDTSVAGVISAQPGIALGEKGEGKVLVATTGRVKIKVDAAKSPIRIGDLLVTSDIPGVAMKSEAVNLGGVQFHRPGTLIGKALEPLEKGSGEILVLLSLQ